MTCYWLDLECSTRCRKFFEMAQPLKWPSGYAKAIDHTHLIFPYSYCEDSLAESVSTLIWVAPRLSADIQELTVIAHQLENKFGKPFTQQARSNMSGTVNPKVSGQLLKKWGEKGVRGNGYLNTSAILHVQIITVRL